MCIMRSIFALTLLGFLGLLPTGSAARPPAGQAPKVPAKKEAPAGQLIPVVFLEPVENADKSAGKDRVYRIIPRDDLRVLEAEHLIDNEPARFTRTLVAWAWQTFGAPADWSDPHLPIVLQKGGNNAAVGLRLLVNGKIEEHPGVPFIVLELDALSLSETLLHEGGHLLHSIAARGRHPSSSWSAITHTTFAVTDPLTALAEGYAIHFETLLGHYGRDTEKRAFYHRLAPAFDLKSGRRAEFYAPITDLMTFSQSWARYQAVRETWPAFAGHVYPGDYVRSQFDPARDRAVLKPANAMIASEGVAASVLFWMSAGIADRAGTAFGLGLDQPGLLEAEQELLRALATLPAKNEFRPDLIDFVSAFGKPGSARRALAISRFVNVTRGVTARPEIREMWRRLYGDAVNLDVDGTKPLFTELDALRQGIVDAATADAGVLRKGIGAVLPVRAPKALLELKAFGQKFPLEFDLNSATEAEWLAAGVDAATAEKLQKDRDRAPFASIQDFETRAGAALQALGLTAVSRR